MSLYRVTTEMFDTNTNIRLHSSDTIIDAISPAQTMRKHNLPRINSNQIITIQITKCVDTKDGGLNTGPSHEKDYPENQPTQSERIQADKKLLSDTMKSPKKKKSGF